MANQLGSLTVAPRAYSRYQEHRKFARIRIGANQFSAFLSQQATRLSSTPALIFAKLAKNSADRIRKAATFASLR
jgi:hypothetical protein